MTKSTDLKPVKIRALKPEDGSRIATLLARTYGAQGVKAIELFSRLRHENAKEPGMFLVAEQNREVLAGAFFHPVRMQGFAGLVLAQFALDPQHEEVNFHQLLQDFFAEAQGGAYDILLLHGFAEEMADLGFESASSMGLEIKPEIPGHGGEWLLASLGKEDIDTNALRQVIELPPVLRD